MDDDPLKLDNRRWLAVPVREFLNVLLVDGHFKSEPFQAETETGALIVDIRAFRR